MPLIQQLENVAFRRRPVADGEVHSRTRGDVEGAVARKAEEEAGEERVMTRVTTRAWLRFSIEPKRVAQPPPGVRRHGGEAPA
jgi:hypothetical protein